MALTQVSTDGIKNGTITGTDLATNIDLVDNQKLRLGTSSDKSEIYNDGDDLFINHTEAGYLQLQGNYGVLLQRHNGTENLLRALSNGAVELYHDNVKIFETKSGGAKVTGDAATILDVIHTNGTQGIGIGFNTISTLGTNTNQPIKLSPRGTDATESAVRLYFNNAEKLRTQSHGITVIGELHLNSHIDMGDNDIIKLGTGDDLQIYHDGSNSRIENSTGSLVLNSRVLIKTADNSESIATFNENGAVELYHNNSKKFETTSSGATVTGSFGVGTTSPANILDVRGSAHAKVLVGTTGTGHATGLQISHAIGDGALQEWQLQTDASADGNLIVRNATTGTATMFFDADNNNVGIGTTSPAAKLHLNGGSYAAPTGGIGTFTQFVISNQAAGKGAGISLLGAGNMVTFINFGDSDDENVGSIVYNNVVDSMQFYVNASERMNIDSNGNLNINNDSGKIRVGTHADLEIFHNGSHSYIQDVGTGTLRIQSSQMNVLKADGSETMATFVADAEVALFYNNSKKFETNSLGVGIGTSDTIIFNHSSGDDTGVVLDGDGSIQVARTNDQCMILNRMGTDGTVLSFHNDGTCVGFVSVSGSTTTYSPNCSDRTLKKNFGDWTENTLSLFKDLTPQTFNFLTEQDTDTKHKGFIAQNEVDKFPEAYPKIRDDKYWFDPMAMVPYLMKAIQELEAEVAALKAS